MFVPQICLVFLLFQCSRANENETCYTRGECLNSPYVALPHTETAKDCHNECRANEDCSAFTWYSSNNGCIGFIECIEFSNSTCSDCYSGYKSCVEPMCFERGRCTGNLLDIRHSENVNECLHNCQSHQSCIWFTFDEAYLECFLLSDCSELVSCSSCHTGHTNCQDQPELSKLMIIGGLNNDKVEVLDLSSSDSTCKDPAQLEEQTFMSTAFMYDDLVYLCGGYKYGRSCFFYDYPNAKWTETVPMLEVRTSFQAIQTGYNEYWFVGGRENNLPKNTTEIFKNGSFHSGPLMPLSLDYFCSVRINSSLAFIGGGKSFDFASNDTFYPQTPFLVELKTMKWTQLPAMNGSRYALACGLFKDEEGNDFVVVAGGSSRNDCEILDLRTLTWTPGPEMPYAIRYSNQGVVQFKDHFVITGGYDHGMDYGNLLMFDKSLKWQKLAQTILPRREQAVVLVPNDIVECKPN